MISELAAEHSEVYITIGVFFVTFALFIFWLIWSNIVSKSYIKYCEDMTKNDE